MRRKKISASLERELLIAMITSQAFLSRVYSVIEQELETLREDRLFYQITDWCLIYFQEYKTAPQSSIQVMYESWMDGNQDQDLGDMVHDFLEEISEEYEETEEPSLNIPYLVDQLSEFLNTKKLRKLQESMEGFISLGNFSKAEELIINHRKVEIGKSEAIRPLNDPRVWERAFSEPYQPLIEFPGAAGRFFNSALTRDGLIGIQAPEKRGKTWWCIEFVFRALQRRKKVAVFEVGDLSEQQFSLRLGVRLAKRPLRKGFCGEIQIPKKVIFEDEEEKKIYSLQYQTEDHQAPVSFQSVERSRLRFFKEQGLTGRNPYLQVSVHANSSINVRGIENILETWEQENGFVPDVIIIDYADILAPETTKRDARDMINDTWKALRRLSQERHALVIVPTQADAGSYGVQTQGMKNFSEDKRKLSHVTGMFALNQTAEEKEIQGMRLNWIVLRESPFNISRCLYVGNCFALGRALTCSSF